jgi:hypothetical protein
MRLGLVLALACLATPVAAADSIADQARGAYQLFAGGMTEDSFMAAGYGKGVLDNVSGNWVRLNGPAASGVETYGIDADKFCQTPAALTLGSPSDMVLTLNTNLVGANFTQQYTLVAGSTFAEHTDPAPYLAAVGLGPDKTGPQADQQRALLLSLANGTVQIYRPSPDVLVMTRDSGYPIVLARCAPGVLPKVQ